MTKFSFLLFVLAFPSLIAGLHKPIGFNPKGPLSSPVLKKALDYMANARLSPEQRANILAEFPIAIGYITIDGPTAPSYFFRNIPLVSNQKNIFFDASISLGPSGSRLPHFTLAKKLADTLLNETPITIEPNPKLSSDIINRFFTISGGYVASKDSSGITQRFLSLQGTNPSDKLMQCFMELNIQNFLITFLNKNPDKRNIKFGWILINFKFDAYGSPFRIDSIDLYYTYQSLNNSLSEKIETIWFELPDKQINNYFTDSNIFNTDCATQAHE